jgi:hypothetical protein
MLFILGTRGRDWRQPAGPDGYVLRAILLDENDKPVRADGMFRAFVVAGPNARDARAVKAWRIGPEQAARRFSEDQWPGYLLELDWLDGLPTRHGVFMLVVRWRGPDETARFTRNVIFEDVNYEQPYKRTLPPGAVEAPQGPAGGDPGPGGADPAGGDSR